MRNRYERAVAATLPGWEYEAIRLTYTVQHTYTPDFIDRDRKIIREAKGHFPPADRRKMRAVRDANPDWRIIIVLQRPDTRISKRSKTTYAQWCERNGFEWEAGPSGQI